MDYELSQIPRKDGSTLMSLRKHLFVCTNQKKEGGGCQSMGSVSLREAVKIQSRDIEGIRVNAAGCLGHCSEGIVAVCYPSGKWFTHLGKDDHQVLVNYLQKGCAEEQASV